MSFTEKLRNVSRNDSRRFAKGVYCKIVYEPKTIELLYKYKIVPAGVQLTTPASYPYFDSTLGKFFALPYTYEKRYDYEMNVLSTNEKSNPSLEQAGTVEDAIQKEMIFVDFLRECLVLITVPVIRLGGSHINPKVFDVIIETSDINQTMDCIFVETSAKISPQKAK